jgi:thiol-disulfide isomerase/thioredoxin
MMAPPFRVTSLEDPNVEFSLDTFKRKYVLLEFWATWCPYCVADLPGVHKVWERFKDKNFDILSFSLDKKVEDIAPFRKSKQPMPWKHAFLPGMKAHPIAEAYGAAGIPKYVLVSPEGKILASDKELRGEKLETALAKFMETPADSVQAVLDAAKAKQQSVMKARKAWMDAGKNTKDFKADCAKELADISSRIETEKWPDVRQALLVSKLVHVTLAKQEPGKDFLAQLLKEVPATCPAWSLQPELVMVAAKADLKSGPAYVAEAREKHADPAVRRTLLVERFFEALEANDEASVKAVNETLQKDYAGSDEAKQVQDVLEAELKTTVGKAAPAFTVPSLDDAKLTFTLDSFKGKYLLIDFWATWCPPCRAEMPHLHKAWEKFKTKNFEILSVSSDRKKEHIAEFRKGPATPMPWKHVYQEGDARKALADAYGVKFIPKPLLIGPDGTIVAKGSDLQGEKLEQTLETYLKQ